VIAPDRSHVFHLYVVRVEKRAELQNHLTQHGIQTGIHYPVPIHLHIAYANLSHGRGTFPIAESLANEILSLPMFPGLTSVQMECVTGAIRSFCGANQ
jgi:dTDP-4-amino-4,6-dideoxygalactose transaminase